MLYYIAKLEQYWSAPIDGGGRNTAATIENWSKLEKRVVIRNRDS